MFILTSILLAPIFPAQGKITLPLFLESLGGSVPERVFIMSLMFLFSCAGLCQNIHKQVHTPFINAHSLGSFAACCMFLIFGICSLLLKWFSVLCIIYVKFSILLSSGFLCICGCSLFFSQECFLNYFYIYIKQLCFSFLTSELSQKGNLKLFLH